MEFDFSPYLRFISKTSYFINEVVVARDLRMLYVLSGEGEFVSREERYHLSKNSLVVYPYGVPYMIKKNTNDFAFYTVNFDFSQEYNSLPVMIPHPISQADKNVLKTIPEKFFDVFGKVLFFENAFWAQPLVRDIYEESLNSQPGYRGACDSYLKILLISIYRKRLCKADNNFICEAIKNAVKSNLKMNIKEIASTLNYHPFYLNEVFKKSEGITLHSYISNRRLSKAIELMSTTSLSLEQISLMCGFSSLAHFSTAFKAAYHISPSNFRKQV